MWLYRKTRIQFYIMLRGLIHLKVEVWNNNPVIRSTGKKWRTWKFGFALGRQAGMGRSVDLFNTTIILRTAGNYS